MTTASKADEISLPQSPDWVERVKEKAFNYMSQYGNCTQCILAAFMEELYRIRRIRHMPIPSRRRNRRDRLIFKGTGRKG